jgi:crotonobetainyl-CoA:carnitine CoA-transferase CaiB-like acyl-CoA transferase
VSRPLEDVRVLALEQFGAGPFGTLQLAELGADVVKIEDPGQGGDVGRHTPPFQEGEDSLFFESFNHDKRSISLDMRSAAGREVFADLVRHADAVFSNLRGDLPPRLGLTYEHLAPVNPRIVCCSLSGFGMTGPRAAEPAYDYLLQGLAGWQSICGEPDGPPTKTGLSLVDMIGGTVAAVSILAGIHRARRDGVGCDCDVSLHEAALSFLNYVGTWHLSGGYVPDRPPMSAHPSIVPFQNLPARDGWLVVACAKEKFWRRLCDGIERPDLAEDPRFATMPVRLAHRAELVAELSRALSHRTVAEWVQRLGDAGVPVAPVLDVPAAFRDPQAQARGVVASYEHPRFGEVRTMRSAARVGDERPPLRRAPRRGEHTEPLLAGLLGYPPERIAALRTDGAFG